MGHCYQKVGVSHARQNACTDVPARSGTIGTRPKISLILCHFNIRMAVGDFQKVTLLLWHVIVEYCGRVLSGTSVSPYRLALAAPLVMLVNETIAQCDNFGL